MTGHLPHLLAWHVSPRGGWVRLGGEGPGLSWTAHPPLFSERIGIRRPILRVGRWRLFALKAVTAGEEA